VDDPGEGEISVSLVRTTVRLLVVALPLYFVWEMLQAPGFTGMPEGWLAATAVCALATLGDGVIVLALLALGAIAFRTARWFAPARIGRYALVALAGVGVQVLVEWVMVYRLGRWEPGANPFEPAWRHGGHLNPECGECSQAGRP
jgi:hypothetical protein